MSETIPLTTLQHWVSQIDPKGALDATDARYVEFDARGLRGSDPPHRDVLADTVSAMGSKQKSCHLFSGFPGTGKTTELARLALALRRATADESTVIVIDAEEYLDRYSPPSITDILRILAWHLDREATRCEGGDPDKDAGYLQRLWTWIQADVDIKAIGLAAYGVHLMAEIKSNPRFRERVEQVLQLRFQEFAAEAHHVIATATARIRAAMGRERVVVVVDGLEKFTALRPDDRSRMEDAIEATFCGHVDWLRIDAHVVYTFPLWLRFRRPDLGGLFDGAPLVLPMVKVVERDGSPCEAGIASLVDMVGRRIDDMSAAFGPDPASTLRPLIVASGGYPRQVLRLVRDTLVRRTFPVPPDIVERVVSQLAEEYKLATLLSDVAVLEHVAAHHDLPSGDAAVGVSGRLFELVQVLTYRNGEEWYSLHPLVQRALDKRAAQA